MTALNMHPTLERFYREVLSYAGLKLDKDVIVNVNEALGDIKVDGKALALPYNETLKYPEGKLIFHPLNENYANADTAQFNLFRKKLMFELNLRLSTLIISLLKVGSDATIQQRFKSTEAISMLTRLGTTEMDMIENFVGLVKYLQKERAENFLFEVFMKKHGEFEERNVEAIGKVNFKLYSDLKKSLEEGEYRVGAHKLRKKDILAYIGAFKAIFPDIDTPEEYMTGTDNKVFRMFQTLLTTTYGVAQQMNKCAVLLEEAKDPSLALEDITSDLRWTSTINDVLKLTDEIRTIPNQTDIRVESHRLKVDESAVRNAPKQTTASAPVYSPPQQQPQQQPTQPVPQPQPQNQAPSPEDIVRGQLYVNPMGGMQAQMVTAPQMIPMQQMYQMQQPMMQPQISNPMSQQQMTTGWTQFNPPPTQMMPMHQMTPMQPQMVPMQQQMVMPPQMMPMHQLTPTQPQQGIAFNPHLMGGRAVSGY